jgi:hypothetical protein
MRKIQFLGYEKWLLVLGFTTLSIIATTVSNCIAHRRCDTGHFTLQFTATINNAVLWEGNLVIHIDGETWAKGVGEQSAEKDIRA